MVALVGLELALGAGCGPKAKGRDAGAGPVGGVQPGAQPPGQVPAADQTPPGEPGKDDSAESSGGVAVAENDSAESSDGRSVPGNDPAGSPAMIPSVVLPTPVVPPTPRAIWIVRTDLVDRKRLANAITWSADTGFTDLFLQVRGRGDAFYRSAIVPRAEQLGSDWDPLAEGLAAAHARGLRVHAWVNVGIAWSGKTRPHAAEHVARRHTDWFVWMAKPGRAPRNILDFGPNELDRRDIEGYFLNPAHPEVGPHLEAVVRELVGSYALDGIHFDYARLPRRIRSLDTISRTSFAASGGVDPLMLNDRKAARSRYGVAESERLTALWESWSQTQVTELIARLSSTARASRPGIMVSAAVYPDPAMARAELSQAWDRWLSERVIDVAVPMCYAADSEIARSNLAVARESTRGRLWAGLGVYNKPLGEALAGAELAKQLGYEGVSIFSYGAAREAGPRASSAIAAALAGFARP
jgi:uncharacterized lipoprotein YddW (UPF0748 family)